MLYFAIQNRDKITTFFDIPLINIVFFLFFLRCQIISQINCRKTATNNLLTTSFKKKRRILQKKCRKEI